MSEIKVNAITDASGGNTTTVNGFTPNIGNMRGRNLVINGNMVIAQRGTSAVTTNSSFAVDRWKNISNASDFSAQQSSVVPSGQEFTKSIHITPTSTKTHDSSNYFFVSHYVEGYNIGGLGYGTSGAKTITVSFWVRSSKTGTYSLGMKNANASRSRQNEYTISVADTWEKKTIVVPGETTGSWPVDNSRGIAFDFCLGGQNTATSSVNTWLNNNTNMSTNQVNFFDDTNNNFYLTGVQVEVGSEATDFDHRSYGEELMLCMRYYEKSYDYSTTPGTSSTSGQQQGIRGNGMFVSPVQFRVPKLGNPSVTIYSSTTGTSGKVNNAQTGSDENASASAISSMGMNVGGTTTSLQDTYRYHWVADKEL